VNLTKLLPCIILISLGLADLFTTLIGVTYFGAVEINPLFAGLTQTNLPAFTAIKLATVLLIGYLFYRAYQIEETSKAGFQLEKRFLQSGYFISLTALTAVVTNNIIAVVGVL
jgi:aconitase B